jgi:hypothetical protein
MDGPRIALSHTSMWSLCRPRWSLAVVGTCLSAWPIAAARAEPPASRPFEPAPPVLVFKPAPPAQPPPSPDSPPAHAAEPAAAAPAPPAPRAIVRPVDPIPRDPGGVYVEVRTTTPNVRIDRIVDGVAVPVCFAPCNRMLPRAGLYVIDGQGIQATRDRFVLPRDRQQLVLDVQGGSSVLHGIGAATAVTGLVTAGLGLFAATIVSLGSIDEEETAQQTDRRLEYRALAVVGVGAAVGILGACLIDASRTKVTTSGGATLSLAPDTSTIHPRRWVLALTPHGLEFC